MYIIVLEVQNYKNLFKTKPDKMKSLLHEIETTVDCAKLYEDGDYLLFECNSEIKYMLEIVNKLSKSLYMSSFLHGVNLFVDIKHELEETNIQAIVSLFRNFIGLNQTCVSAEFAKEVESLGIGTCTPIDDERVWQLTSLDIPKPKQRVTNASEYSKHMKKLLKANDSPRLYIETQNEVESWLYAETVPAAVDIVFTKNYIALYKPFLRIHTPVSVDELIETMLPEDQAIILRTNGLLERSEYTWSHSDVYLRLSALLKGYSLYFKNKDKKPVLQILNAHLMAPAQRTLLLQLIGQKDIIGDFRIIAYGDSDPDNDIQKELKADCVSEDIEIPESNLEDWLKIHDDEIYRSIVYGCIDLHSILNVNDIIRSLAIVLERPVREIQSVIQMLREEKVMFGRQYLSIPDKDILLEQKNDLFLKREILSSVDDILKGSQSSGVLPYEVIQTCMSWNYQQLSLSDFLTVSLHLLRYRKYNQIEILFDYLFESKPLFPELDLLNEFVCLKKHMARNELPQAEKIFKRLVFFDDVKSVLYPHIRLAIGEYHYNSGKYPECLNIAKKLVFYAQENELPELETPAHMLIGHAMLKLGKNNESLEYFGIAVDESKNSVYPGDYTHALVSKSISLFIRGNYSLAIRNIEAAFTSSENEGFVDLKIFCKFFSGRCHFIVGQYEEALLLFQESLVESSLNRNKEWELLLQCWMGRCYGYMGHFDRAFNMLESLPENTESLFFLSECHYFYDHVKEACELAHKALENCEELLPEPNQYLLFQPIHGFYDVEGRAFDHPHLVLLKVIMSFWGYLENYTYTKQTALEVFDDLLKSENLSDNDPYVYFYYLCYGLTDKLKNHDDVLEYLTVLSKGIRHIQGIAARIDDVDKRLSYLHKAYWPKKMIDAGQTHKLT